MQTGVPFHFIMLFYKCGCSACIHALCAHLVPAEGKEEAVSAGTGIRVNCELPGGAGSSGRTASALSQ